MKVFFAILTTESRNLNEPSTPLAHEANRMIKRCSMVMIAVAGVIGAVASAPSAVAGSPEDCYSWNADGCVEYAVCFALNCNPICDILPPTVCQPGKRSEIVQIESPVSSILP